MNSMKPTDGTSRMRAVIAAITALVLLVPSIGFMLFIERFLKAEVVAKIGG